MSTARAVAHFFRRLWALMPWVSKPRPEGPHILSIASGTPMRRRLIGGGTAPLEAPPGSLCYVQDGAVYLKAEEGWIAHPQVPAQTRGLENT
jgi:hypothetical protein